MTLLVDRRSFVHCVASLVAGYKMRGTPRFTGGKTGLRSGGNLQTLMGGIGMERPCRALPDEKGKFVLTLKVASNVASNKAGAAR